MPDAPVFLILSHPSPVGHDAADMPDQIAVIVRADDGVQSAALVLAARMDANAQAIAAVANWWGGPGIIWFGAAAWLSARAVRRCNIARIGCRGVEALVVASGITAIVKLILGRARPYMGYCPWHWEPFAGLKDAGFLSMPSGHTTAATAFAVAAVLATAGWPVWRRMAVGMPLVLSALVVAWARIVTNQHWLSDIIVAWFIAVTTGIVLARIHARHEASSYDRVLIGREAAVAGSARAGEVRGRA